MNLAKNTQFFPKFSETDHSIEVFDISFTEYFYSTFIPLQIIPLGYSYCSISFKFISKIRQKARVFAVSLDKYGIKMMSR